MRDFWGYKIFSNQFKDKAVTLCFMDDRKIYNNNIKIILLKRKCFGSGMVIKENFVMPFNAVGNLLSQWS